MVVTDLGVGTGHNSEPNHPNGLAFQLGDVFIECVSLSLPLTCSWLRLLDSKSEKLPINSIDLIMETGKLKLGLLIL